MIIASDIDDVLVPFVPEWIRRYNIDYGDNLKVEEINEWSLLSFVKPKCGKKIYDYIEQPNIYDNLLPIEGSLKGINNLKKQGHRIIYATASTEGHAKVKYHWLKKYGFIDNINDYAELHDKSLIYADILIDDRYDNVKNFRGLGILYRAPWNKNSPYYTWMSGWNDMTYLNENFLNKEFALA